jgi:hypothetical protein
MRIRLGKHTLLANASQGGDAANVGALTRLPRTSRQGGNL